MLNRNAELDRALTFIRSADFDVFCLQEVPHHFLGRLLDLPCHHAYSVERTYPSETTPSATVRDYLVVLSRYPISREARVPIQDYWDDLPTRTRFIIRLLRRFHFTRVSERSNFLVDIETPNGTVHVYNLHLILAHPEWRLCEFESALATRDKARPTIVCGDFNIVESWPMTVLNWLLGGKVREAFYRTQERTSIEKRFVAHELVNPLRGTITHTLSRSQLDHILVSPTFVIKHAEVLHDRSGSDHNPILVEALQDQVLDRLS